MQPALPKTVRLLTPSARTSKQIIQNKHRLNTKKNTGFISVQETNHFTQQNTANWTRKKHPNTHRKQRETLL
jgi:hypothetical protein